jgi:hypothetical protein
MKSKAAIFRTCFLAVGVAVLSGCATVKPMPAANNPSDTLVVIPKLLIDARQTMTKIYYTLDLMVEDIKTQKEKGILIDQDSPDYLYLQNITPGKYLIKKRDKGGSQQFSTYDKYLEVQPGRMAIFPYKVVLQIDEVYWYNSLVEIEKEDLAKIHGILAGEAGYASWKRGSE